MKCVLPGCLKNQYYAMRHGRSEANEAGIVISDPVNGVTKFGLSPRGRAQVEDSLRLHPALNNVTRIVSSDFLRARETAELVRQRLRLQPPVMFDAGLRERFFGIHEAGSDDIYPRVWEMDRKDPAHREGGVEDAVSVQRRVAAVVASLEQDFSGETFLLVAHGDPLQIMQTAFAAMCAGSHRDLPHLETAGVVPLVRQLRRIEARHEDCCRHPATGK